MLRALKSIDKVHRDGSLPKTEVSFFSDGFNKRGYFSWPPSEIRLNKNGSHVEATFVHEVGHLLDVFGIGGGVSACDTDARFDAWKVAVSNNESIRRLAGLKSRRLLYIPGPKGPDIVTIDSEMVSHAEYLLLWHEIWARSYFQFIAEESGDRILLDQLGSMVRSEYGLIYHSQWATSEFRPIRMAIKNVFASIGWT